MSQKQQDKEEETNKDGEESNNNLSFGSGIIPAFGAGLQQPTFDFTGGDFSIQKVEDDGISVPTATYADDNFSFPSTVAFGTSISTPKIQFGKVNTPGGDRRGSTTTNNNSDNNNNNSNNQLSFGSGPSTSGNSSNSMLSVYKLRSKSISKKTFSSLARPINERQSPLFGVNSSSRILFSKSCSWPS